MLLEVLVRLDVLQTRAVLFERGGLVREGEDEEEDREGRAEDQRDAELEPHDDGHQEVAEEEEHERHDQRGEDRDDDHPLRGEQVVHHAFALVQDVCRLLVELRVHGQTDHELRGPRVVHVDGFVVVPETAVADV